MSPEFIQYLEDTYPEIFSGNCEISVDDGWFHLVDVLCKQIQTYIYSSVYRHTMAIEWNKDVNDPNYDWKKTRRFIERKERKVPEIVEQVVAVQINEKFGGLRFDCLGGDEYVNGAINLAEALSKKICEKCGAPGETNKTGRWIKTFCEEHQIEQKERIKNQ